MIIRAPKFIFSEQADSPTAENRRLSNNTSERMNVRNTDTFVGSSQNKTNLGGMSNYGQNSSNIGKNKLANKISINEINEYEKNKNLSSSKSKKINGIDKSSKSSQNGTDLIENSVPFNALNSAELGMNVNTEFTGLGSVPSNFEDATTAVLQVKIKMCRIKCIKIAWNKMK